jgi:hypothetical protein
MKNIFKTIILLISFTFLISCEKDEDKVIIKDTVSQNTLSALSASSYVLSMDDATDTFQIFRWTAPDYGFSAAITYTLQMDVKGNDFASAKDIATVIPGDSAIVIVSDLNKALLEKELDAETAYTMQFRVKCWINDSVDLVYSNTVEAIITPYSTSFDPIYMCGAALGGWSWDKAVEVRSSASGIYGTIAYFYNNSAFRFFKAKDWSSTSYNYPYFTGTVSSLFQNANDGDLNLYFNGTTGYYQVDVNLKTKSVAMTAVDEPLLYMTGAALGGWDWTDNDVKMTWVSDGVFTATTEFINNGAFRFFKQAGWADSYNYPAFSTGSVTSLLENANDGDSNFKFVGTTGNYTITVNLLNYTITMEAVQ